MQRDPENHASESAARLERFLAVNPRLDPAAREGHSLGNAELRRLLKMDGE